VWDLSNFQTHWVVHCCKQPCCAKLMCCDHCNKAALPRLKGQQSSTEHSSCCGCCISLKHHGCPLTDSKLHVDAAMSEQAWSNEPHLESLPRCVAHHRCHCCATKASSAVCKALVRGEVMRTSGLGDSAFASTLANTACALPSSVNRVSYLQCNCCEDSVSA